MNLSQRAGLALLVCLPILAWAQQASAPPAAAGQPEAASPAAPQAPALAPPPASAPQVADGRIHLDVTVTDKSGKPISGLDLKDFTLLDNNQPAKILSFQAFDGTAQKPNPPVEVILAIDTVNDMHQQVALVRQDIEKFLRQNGGHLAQPVSIFLISDEKVEVRRRPSVDGNALAEEVKNLDDRLREIRSSEGLYGSIDRFEISLKMLTAIANAEAKKPGRKLLIWTDSGWPLLISPRIETTTKGQQQLFDSIVDLSALLREAHISVYSISSGIPGGGTFLYQDYLKGVRKVEKTEFANLGLKVLAVQSGGRILGPDNDLAAQINRCVQDAGAYYTLSFDPPRAAQANEYHDLKVLVGQPGLTARANTGYYNQP
jgi:VWFA-related protein